MANEGSTKPTYSELATKLVDECSVYGDDPHSGFVGLDHEKVTAILSDEFSAMLRRYLDVHEEDSQNQYDELRESESELARVRGLLQRIADGEECVCRCDDHTSSECCNNVGEFCSTCLAESALQGAGSADIGKLDAADKSAGKE